MHFQKSSQSQSIRGRSENSQALLPCVFFLFFPWPPPCTSRSRLKKSACSAGCFNLGLIFSILEMLLCFIHVHVFIWIARSVNEQDFHWLQMHFQKSSQSQLISGRSANSQALLTGVFFPFFSPALPLAYPSSMYIWVTLKKNACSAGYFNLGFIFSIQEMLLCFIHVRIVFIWIARSVEIFSKK